MYWHRIKLYCMFTKKTSRKNMYLSSLIKLYVTCKARVLAGKGEGVYIFVLSVYAAQDLKKKNWFNTFTYLKKNKEVKIPLKHLKGLGKKVITVHLVIFYRFFIIDLSSFACSFIEYNIIKKLYDQKSYIYHLKQKQLLILFK